MLLPSANVCLAVGRRVLTRPPLSQRLLEAAQQGCERVYDALKAVLREETTLRVARASEPIEDVVGEAGQR